MKISYNKGLLFVVLMLLCPFIVLAQELGARLKVTCGTTDKMKLYIYDSTFVIKILDKQPSVNSLDCPEKLIQSLYSASNQDWMDMNIYGGSVNSEKKKDSYFSSVKNTSKEKYFIRPVHKLEFEIDEVKYCAIKYYIHMAELKEPMAAVSLLISEQGVWYKTKDYVFSSGSIAFLKVKSDKLNDLLFNPSKDAFIKEVRQQVADANGVNFSKFAKLMNKWYEDKNEAYIKYFVDEKVW